MGTEDRLLETLDLLAEARLRENRLKRAMWWLTWVASALAALLMPCATLTATLLAIWEGDNDLSAAWASTAWAFGAVGGCMWVAVSMAFVFGGEAQHERRKKVREYEREQARLTALLGGLD